MSDHEGEISVRAYHEVEFVFDYFAQATDGAANPTYEDCGMVSFEVNVGGPAFIAMPFDGLPEELQAILLEQARDQWSQEVVR